MLIGHAQRSRDHATTAWLQDGRLVALLDSRSNVSARGDIWTVAIYDMPDDFSRYGMAGLLLKRTEEYVILHPSPVFLDWTQYPACVEGVDQWIPPKARNQNLHVLLGRPRRSLTFDDIFLLFPSLHSTSGFDATLPIPAVVDTVRSLGEAYHISLPGVYPADTALEHPLILSTSTIMQSPHGSVNMALRVRLFDPNSPSVRPVPVTRASIAQTNIAPPTSYFEYTHHASKTIYEDVMYVATDLSVWDWGESHTEGHSRSSEVMGPFCVRSGRTIVIQKREDDIVVALLELKL